MNLNLVDEVILVCNFEWIKLANIIFLGEMSIILSITYISWAPYFVGDSNSYTVDLLQYWTKPLI